ncbi:MAG: acetyl-CoA carboxylase biotin carboxylase subunit [Flavobacteriales bacterium]|jgi:propionyl-CoA carboxylase alpha chain|nr:acetyl-CoA carboxylase biotin carboxylase subunit [Flavobacteriales bacterium]NCG28843.1 acetyl-CoA carboxylase biotin carboxylase subunit [Bacteroidota bacterium]MBT3963060.1 acetyl-CoA carboxylase biotin carboxylase subunit [Flavobacteriales bacterium]MBT4704326.1 acetyl-CoA carboxylase biotin carboxylase subunit [Flavobacteriales bacterium]MBT4930518.1 acetyl-CoA carboxylase biotin carboxylase subunit [Flavobacteriales bacterium]
MKKILIANRGEIALRIMRTCREMGIQTVAVFSEADRNALFVQYADEAFCIGPPASSESYLRIDKIIEVAKKTNSDGVHPGYGFLSENSEFARRLEKEGIILIGPSAESMEVMGDKLAAKETAMKSEVPLVPGSEGAISDLEEAKKVAQGVGFPLLIKASAGGGGKGMRAVDEIDQIEEQLKLAMSEAKSAFGDPSVFIERYVKSPRHIEIQILADQHGNCVYLFERECSIQRRHQKVVEEAPSSVLTPELRKEMGECAVQLALACNYIGAGTVEFLLDDKHNFFFLEMNTRLQVEHPVSEMITGIDLVKQQILVARGEKLAFSQDDLEINGHALEVRVYAENPQNNFLPDIGTLSTYRRPQGTGIRVDDGFEEGMDIPIYYDPMIAKLITYASTREEAIDRMTRAIEEFEITGVTTTLDFCKLAINHEAFTSGNFDTHFVQDHFSPEMLDSKDEDISIAAAAFIGMIDSAQEQTNTTVDSSSRSKWKSNRKRLL